MLKRLMGLGLVVGATVLTAQGEASACGHAMRLPTQPRAPAVAARQGLERGHAEATVKFSVGEAELDSETYLDLFVNNHVWYAADRLKRELQLLLARAVIDTGGRLHLGNPTPPEVARENLRWASITVRSQLSAVSDPMLQTYLARALAKLPNHKHEALLILAELAERDVLPSAEGYAVLAELRRDQIAEAPPWLVPTLQRVHGPALKVEKERCEEMAVEPQICGVANRV